MRLFGRYNSPYVRRVAVTLQLYGFDYDHDSVIPFGDAKSGLANLNPITRVPVLELEGGECLIDSAAIIDHLDELAGPDHALTPRDGPLRRRVLSLLGVELGIMDKLVSVLYERQFRPREKWHQPWIEACETQISDGFHWLDGRCEGDWLTGAKMTQADLSLAVFWDFATRLRPNFFANFNCSHIDKITEKLRITPAFDDTLPTEGALSAKLIEEQVKETAI